MSRFGTFWKGPSLSAFEAARLHTFAAGRHDVTLFSYEPVANVPIGAEETVGPDRASSAGMRGLPCACHWQQAFAGLA